jgi:hypothetical protein
MIKFLEGKHEDGLGVPYPSSANSNGANAGYFDLKKDPYKIAEIPELNGWPEFESFIRSVNSDGGFFRTLRCDVWFASLSGHPKFKRIAVGYATTAFEILEFNTSERCFEELRNRFVQFAPECSKWLETVIYFKHIPTSYNDHGIDRAWSEDIEIHGLGINDKDARKSWLKGLRVVQDFLSKESSAYSGELNKGRKTLS